MKQKRKTKSKYNNKKVELDGCIFNSEAESKYYELLKEKQGAGEIQANEEALGLGEARASSHGISRTTL
ncbi:MULTISPECIES: DUF1064 domain-containing protein [Bacillus]|uniref:DUF1064 domain-containing protein n=1 Tax=Bacillus TaxID=1386 RepID=UPI003D6580C6